MEFESTSFANTLSVMSENHWKNRHHNRRRLSRHWTWLACPVVSFRNSYEAGVIMSVNACTHQYQCSWCLESPRNKTFLSFRSWIIFINQTCRNPGSWMYIHTCHQGSDSYLTNLRFILDRDLRFILDTICCTCLNQIRSNLKYIRGGPEGLMKCIYRPFGANE